MGSSFSKVSSQPKQMVSLASHYKLLGFFFVVNDGAQIDSCNLVQIMWCIVYHSNPIDGNVSNVSHGKIKGLMNYNKNHRTSSLKKHVFHEHVEDGNRWDLSMQKVQGNKNQWELTKERENVPPFFIIQFLSTINLTTKLTLHNMPFLKT